VSLKCGFNRPVCVLLIFQVCSRLLNQLYTRHTRRPFNDNPRLWLSATTIEDDRTKYLSSNWRRRNRSDAIAAHMAGQFHGRGGSTRSAVLSVFVRVQSFTRSRILNISKFNKFGFESTAYCSTVATNCSWTRLRASYEHCVISAW